MTRSGRTRLLSLVVAAAALALSACAKQPAMLAEGVPGIVSGFFHGLLVVFSLLGSPITKFAIYEFPNAGFSYDLGFTAGVIALAHCYALLYGAIRSRKATAKTALQRDAG